MNFDMKETFTENKPELVEIIRLYAPQSVLRSGSWIKDYGECKNAGKELVSSCKHQLGLDAQAFFLRCPVDRRDRLPHGPKPPQLGARLQGEQR